MKAFSTKLGETVKKLWHFHGGLHLSGHKERSTEHPIIPARLPRRLVIPVSQHIGQPASPIVEVGEQVYKGQVLAIPDGYISAPVHASSSGKVIAIGEQPVPHPSGLSALCITLETDGRDSWDEIDSESGEIITVDKGKNPITDIHQLSATALRQHIRDAGIVGLGGAAFPSAVKLNPGACQIETLILNAAECEPYITCDDMLMREFPEQIIQGSLLMLKALDVKQCIIGIEDNKPEAYEALLDELKQTPLDSELDVQIVQVPSIYPAGGEKQLIHVLTGKEVPSEGLPNEVGIVCHNVATAASVYKAVVLGEPLLSRIVTITGDAVDKAQNLEVLIGTPVNDILQQSELVEAQLDRLLMGGPMMGFALAHTDVPVIKATNCLLAAARDELDKVPEAMPCIRCGACAEACPAQLLPQQLYWYAQAKDLEKVQDYNLFDCIECGCCSYVCPSNIPLVSYYRFAKTEIWSQEKEKEKADIARQRHEFRQFRIERAKQEKAERDRKKKAALAAKKKAAGDKSAAKPDASKDDKSDMIKAAMERVKAKKEQQSVAPKNTENLTEAQQKQIQEADKRRGETANQSNESNKES